MYLSQIRLLTRKDWVLASYCCKTISWGPAVLLSFCSSQTKCNSNTIMLCIPCIPCIIPTSVTVFLSYRQWQISQLKLEEEEEDGLPKRGFAQYYSQNGYRRRIIIIGWVNFLRVTNMLYNTALSDRLWHYVKVCNSLEWVH